MTINIGINLGKYILLFADTRTIYFSGNQRLYNDDDQKIVETGIGLITGAGYKDLLDAVKEQIQQTEITHTDQITNIVKQQSERFQRNPFVREEWFEMTCWVFTYTTKQNNSPVLRLALMHPEFDYTLRLYEENLPCVILPEEATQKEADIILDLIKQKIKPLEALSQINENIKHHIGLIMGIIWGTSELFDSISRQFHVGIHLIDGKQGIFPVKEDGTFNIDL